MSSIALSTAAAMVANNNRARLRTSVLAVATGTGRNGFFMESVNKSLAAGRLWQDTAGTVPVSMIGDPVRRVDDDFARRYLALPSGATTAPTLQQDARGLYVIRGSGALGESLTTNGHSTNLASVNGSVLLAYAAKAPTINIGTTTAIRMLSYGIAIAGSTYIVAPIVAGSSAQFGNRSDANVVEAYNISVAALGAQPLLAATALWRIAGTPVNKAQVNSLTGTGVNASITNFASAALSIGQHTAANTSFIGDVYSALLVSTAAANVITDLEFAQVQSFMNQQVLAY